MLVFNGYDLGVAGTFHDDFGIRRMLQQTAASVIVDKVGPRWAYSPSAQLHAPQHSSSSCCGAEPRGAAYVAGFFFGAALSSSAVCFSSATTMYPG